MLITIGYMEITHIQNCADGVIHDVDRYQLCIIQLKYKLVIKMDCTNIV